MQTRKIFLASSEELREDRRDFELMIGQLNQEWFPRGIFFHLVIWENFIDAMSKEGLQQEYNKAIRSCDIFVLLFFTKVGRFTLEEFEAAFGAFKDGKSPLIYTYFKDALVLTGDIDETIVSLLEFKKKLAALGHYYTRYRSAEELKWLFSRQLDKLYGQQSQAESIALDLANRFLTQSGTVAAADASRLREAIRHSGEPARRSVFLLAQDIRSNNWTTNKALMERAIPVFRALVDFDPNNHDYLGELAFALKDQNRPDWQAAKELFDQAIGLLGSNGAATYPYYWLDRAICSVKLDANFAQGERSDPAVLKSIVQDLRVATLHVGDLGELLGKPWNVDARRWLELNGSPRLT